MPSGNSRSPSAPDKQQHAPHSNIAPVDNNDTVAVTSTSSSCRKYTILIILAPILIVFALVLGILLLFLSPFLRWGLPPLLRCFRCCGQDVDWKTNSRSARCRGDPEFAKMKDLFTYVKGTLISKKRGYKLRSQHWTPTFHGLSPRGTVVLFHGLYSHVGEVFLSKDYTLSDSMLERYIAEGFEVWSLDHQSHGASEGWQGLRGHVYQIDDVVADAVQFLEEVVKPSAKHTLSSKVFIHGHSFGGMISLLVSQACSIDGMVLTTPAVAIAPTAKAENASTIKYLWWLPSIVPWLPLGGTPPNTVYPELERRFKQDPMCTTCDVRCAFGFEMLRKMIWFDEGGGVEKISTPFLVMHGKNDILADPHGSRLLYKRANAKDKQLYLIKNMWHDMLLEPGAHEVFDLAIAWIEKRMDPQHEHKGPQSYDNHKVPGTGVKEEDILTALQHKISVHHAVEKRRQGLCVKWKAISALTAGHQSHFGKLSAERSSAANKTSA